MAQITLHLVGEPHAVSAVGAKLESNGPTARYVSHSAHLAFCGGFVAQDCRKVFFSLPGRILLLGSVVGLPRAVYRFSTAMLYLDFRDLPFEVPRHQRLAD